MSLLTTLNQGKVMSSFDRPKKEEIEKINKILGVSDYVLRGSTFAFKSHLSATGWKWDKNCKGWRLDNVREDDPRLKEVRGLKKTYLGRP